MSETLTIEEIQAGAERAAKHLLDTALYIKKYGSAYPYVVELDGFTKTIMKEMYPFD